MRQDLEKGKIIFIDDDEDAVAPYVQQLKDEGFTNVSCLSDVSSLHDLIQQDADLIFLDITGVGTSLDEDDEGLVVLQYVKNTTPWTRIVVLSGSEFPASKANALSMADVCATKASLTLAELITLTEEQLNIALSPEFRNVKILEIISKQISDLNLNWFSEWRLRRIVCSAVDHQGDTTFDWSKLVKKARSILRLSSEVAPLLQLLIG